MSHADPAPREGFWGRVGRWMTDSYVGEAPATVTCLLCQWSVTRDTTDGLGDLLAEHVDAVHGDPGPAPDLADDLPHVLTNLTTAATKAASPTQQTLVAAVAAVLEEHATWLTQHPDASQPERTATAQRAVFRAVQAGIDVVRPAAASNARRAALEEAAAYVAAQRSPTEAAEGLRRHLDDPALPVRVERYPHAELAARTTGPLPVVAAAEGVEIIDIN